MARGFEYFVGAIEDAIIAALKVGAGWETLEKPGTSLIKTIKPYSGELDAASLKEAIAALTPAFPLMLVSYTDGTNEKDPANPAALFGESIQYRHDCGFVVICASNDARSEDARRRGNAGTYKLVETAQDVLSGLRLAKMEGSERVDLTSEPFEPGDVAHLAKIPNITAYGAMFFTSFHWKTTDRTQAGSEVETLVLDVGTLPVPEDGDDPEIPITPTTNVPGVVFEEET